MCQVDSNYVQINFKQDIRIDNFSKIKVWVQFTSYPKTFKHNMKKLKPMKDASSQFTMIVYIILDLIA